MPNNMMPQTMVDAELTEQSKAIALFQFIKELNKLKQKAILNVKDYLWSFALSNIPDDPDNITVFYRDRVEDESADVGSVLLSVHKPEFQSCPEPDEILVQWLKTGWDNYRLPVAVKDTLPIEGVRTDREMPQNPFDEQESAQLAFGTDAIAEGEETQVHFADDEQRVNAYNSWLELRSAWVEKQKITEKTRNLFTDLYRLYFELQRDSETMEIIAANGILCDRDKPDLCHPVLTHRVKLNYDADDNTVYIEDTNVSSELYSIAFQMMEDVNLSAINVLSNDLQKNDYHPLDRNDTPGFLKVLVHQLSSDSMFSEDGAPYGWRKSNRLLLYIAPCYIVRKRLDGTLRAIEQIIENVQETGEVPDPIGDIVSGGKIAIPEDDGKETVEEQLASVGGESVDILLSKEANKEQLEIAKRINYYNAVLVQGPPGTGKTHTIANLMGHFLAQGKSVLVTSHTIKALSVLKGKVAPGLQNLCVSILDDSNLDMERSIDGITDYMSKTTSNEVKREKDMLSVERKQIISSLAAIRRKIFAIISQESNCIVYNGEDISPSKAAEFVLDHAEDLSYIPGKVRQNYSLPLTFEQLVSLYRSNERLTAQDEQELESDIPNVSQILTPDEFARTWENYQSALRGLMSIEEENGWRITNLEDDRQVEFVCPFGTFTTSYPEREAVSDLKTYAVSFGKIEKWMKCAAVDGKNGGAFRQRWCTLIEQIQKTCAYAEGIVSEQFGLDIHFSNSKEKASLKDTLETLRGIFADKGKIPKLTMLMHKNYAAALEAVSINSKRLQSASDCDIILHCIEMESIRKKCEVYWDELLSVHDVPKFIDLDTHNQERIASNWIPYIQKYLDWYFTDYQPLMYKMEACGFRADMIFCFSNLDSELTATDKILFAVEHYVPILCDACETIRKMEDQVLVIDSLKTVLTSGRCGNSRCCAAIMEAIVNGDVAAYSEAYAALDTMYAKYKLQSDRTKMLKTLEPVAPQWADAIRNRVGVHGKFTVPSTIEDAWKWKQLSGIIDEITTQPFRELQADSLRLSKEYRRTTALYAEKCGWYHLIKRTEADIDMKQALQGWKQTVKRIGKGTGKNAPTLKARARELMTKCQNAVPGWIMPINRALESLNPKQNRFDIIIIDEASQSDISSLAILYMGRKLIIVGDDKQVSPMAVGVEVDKMNALEQMYIKDKIPNSHLYNAKTSIYDIAATTFQPLMLREHFRCVPEIIGFSNMLSYDYKIKPLRDASNSNLLPAVVSYRVADGQREGRNKVNRNEARAIVALMRACMEQPEYKGKSIGVISLLGDEQVKVIQRIIEEKIDPKEIVLRNILCGNSANFQGDERDVIFLSVVDSGDGNGPIRMQNFGTDDAYRKRYNVATSRARDQLWVVHSLDSANDLKPGDIRKTLIDYAVNPQDKELKRVAVEKEAESPFEAAVATTLVSRGYHLVQQWKVGAYRLDMVAVCGKKTVAIECDGERWHSGEAKIREDMERQTILERLGWRFIRIRGSEYFRDPEAAMNRVIKQLQDYGIEPEATATVTDESRNTELLSRVKNRAGIILYEEDGVPELEIDTITAALNPTEVTSAAPVAEIVKPVVPVVSHRPLAADKTPDATPVVVAQAEDWTLEELQRKPFVATESTPMLVEVSKPIATKIENAKVNQPNQMVFKGLEDMAPDANDVLSLLKKHNVKYIDKRKFNGALWIVGGQELDNVVREVRAHGCSFKFKPDGGKATKGKPGWWIK